MTNSAPLQAVDHPLLQARKVSLLVKREDLSHPKISGNKWHKLKYNLEYAQQQGLTAIASFGGIWSNHLHALAYAGKQLNIKTIGLVRGDLPQPLNAMLQDACNWGMELRSLGYSDYRRRYDNDFTAQLMASVVNGYLIPEGGANKLAIKGCVGLAQEIRQQRPDLDVLCAACGTGATLAGLISGIGSDVEVLGFSALKDNRALATDIESWLPQGSDQLPHWRLIEDYHCGGFARLNRVLVAFMDDWQCHSDIPLEPLYTGKLFYGLFEMIGADQFAPGTTIVALHSGGLQGLRGMEGRMAEYRGK